MNDLAKHLCDKYEVVKPFLKNAADQHQPNRIDPSVQENDFRMRPGQDDMMFNNYEESPEDEKANQEAFRRSQNLTQESKESRLKKLSFLSNRTQEEPEEEFSLVKPAISPQTSPKIVIDDKFLTTVKQKENNEKLPQYGTFRNLLSDMPFCPEEAPIDDNQQMLDLYRAADDLNKPKSDVSLTDMYIINPPSFLQTVDDQDPVNSKPSEDPVAKNQSLVSKDDDSNKNEALHNESIITESKVNEELESKTQNDVVSSNKYVFLTLNLFKSINHIKAKRLYNRENVTSENSIIKDSSEISEKDKQDHIKLDENKSEPTLVHVKPDVESTKRVKISETEELEIVKTNKNEQISSQGEQEPHAEQEASDASGASEAKTDNQ